MADSESSTSLPTVTRRELLSGTLTHQFHPNSPATAEPLRAHAAVVDVALSLWRDWSALHGKTAELCRKQQQLETKLVKTVGFPHAVVAVPGRSRPVSVSSIEQLENLVGTEPETLSVRAKAQAELAAHQARWDAADSLIGYSAAKQKEEDAAECDCQLAEALWAVQARSLAGVSAKLDAILRQGESCEDCMEFPWPQIRSALIDLIQIGKLDSAFPGKCAPPR